MTAYVRAHYTDDAGTRFWRYACPRPSDGAWVMTSGWQADPSKGTEVRSVATHHEEYGTGDAVTARAFVEALALQHIDKAITIEGTGGESRTLCVRDQSDELRRMLNGPRWS